MGGGGAPLRHSSDHKKLQRAAAHRLSLTRLRLRVDLRPWQQEALSAWRANRDQGVAAVVTGGGKTILAYACILDLLTRRPDTPVVVLVPTVALLDQWAVGLTDDFDIAPNDLALAGGGFKLGRPGPINLMVINSGRSVAPGLAKERPTFLIVDECHRIASRINSRALAGEHVATLGLSATPDRDFDDLFTTIVEPILGPVVYRYDYNEARRDGVISPFELINVKVPLLDEEENQYARLTRGIASLFKRREKGGDVEDQLHRLLRQRARVSVAAKMRLPAVVRLASEHRRERMLIFHEQIDAANVLTALLRDQQHRVAAYHSGLGPTLRQDNLRLFRRGEIDILVTCRALDEGINVPNARVAIIAASTASTRQRIQRLGRVLRPASGKERALIYTLYASEPEAVRLRMEAADLEGADAIRWMSIRGS